VQGGRLQAALGVLLQPSAPVAPRRGAMMSARKSFESSGLLVSSADVRIFFSDMIASIQSGKKCGEGSAV
jgi:hypothetical protein